MAKTSKGLIAGTILFSLIALGIVGAVFLVVIGQARPDVIERLTGPPATTSTTLLTAGTAATPLTTAAPATDEPASPTTTSTTRPPRPPGTVPASTVGQPWGSIAGVTMFRGNPTRTYYGTGPVPDSPETIWRYPEDPMCGTSTVGGEPSLWCGTGWTGQPAVWVRPDGVTEVVFGAYDKAVHFLDAETGRPTRPRFEVGDLIKGSVTIDPDGYPLLYFGSRDNRLRVVALDREAPSELWALNADSVNGVWNNDWDGNPAIVDDVMYEGGENSWFFAVKLNRDIDDEGYVTVDPTVVFETPGYTPELRSRVGNNVSIENSVVLFERRVYFANSGGRVVGLDTRNIELGEAPVVFDFWAGDDIDATMVVDDEGMLYVSIEQERFNARSRELGQLIKLDPYTTEDPLVWSVAVPAAQGEDGGIWATPALHAGHLYVATHPGELLVVDTETGEVVFRDDIGWHAWSSPVVVADTLLVSTNCVEGAGLRAYDLADPVAPTLLWEATETGGCIESTPVVWDGRIYVGSRDGYFYAFGE
jgi:outer membrane protein assembly factor BamB